MKILTKLNVIKSLTVLGFIVSINFSGNVLANEHEAACKAHIQGQIAWDTDSNYNSAAKWEDINLERLCTGTKNPKEPGECFHHVMTGHVKWGASDKWEWKNAIDLCAGTDSADKTITCFKDKIAAGKEYDDAINSCKSSSNKVTNLNKVAPGM